MAWDNPTDAMIAFRNIFIACTGMVDCLVWTQCFKKQRDASGCVCCCASCAWVCLQCQPCKICKQTCDNEFYGCSFKSLYLCQSKIVVVMSLIAAYVCWILYLLFHIHLET